MWFLWPFGLLMYYADRSLVLNSCVQLLHRWWLLYLRAQSLSLWVWYMLSYMCVSQHDINSLGLFVACNPVPHTQGTLAWSQHLKRRPTSGHVQVTEHNQTHDCTSLGKRKQTTKGTPTDIMCLWHEWWREETWEENERALEMYG